MQFLTAILFISVSLFSPVTIWAQGTWTQGPNLPVIQSEWAGTVWGDSIYCMGGEGDKIPDSNSEGDATTTAAYSCKGQIGSGGNCGNGNAANELWIYNVITEEFHLGASMPAGRNHLSVTALEGKIYALGGYPEPCCGAYPWLNGQRNLYRYDPGANEWLELAELPRGFGAGMLEAFGGKLYALSGTRDEFEFSSVTDAHVYDITTDTWTQVASMSVPHGHVRGAVVDSLIYVVSGHQDDGNPSNKKKLDQPAVEAYAPASDTWYDKGEIPSARGGLGVIYFAGKIYVLAGEYANGGRTDRVDIYDVITGEWTQGAKGISSNHGMCTALHAGTETIHLIGGSAEGGYEPTDLHHIYKIEPVAGCTDNTATNFNIYATKDDGSCVGTKIVRKYIPSEYKLISVKQAGNLLYFSRLTKADYSVKIVGLSGKVLKSFEFEGYQFQTDVSNFNSGVYIIKISSEFGTLSKQVFID